MSLGRDELLAALKRPAVEVEVPEIGGSVHLRDMSVRERMAFHASILGEDGKLKVTQQEWDLKIAVASLSDAGGTRLFTDGEEFLDLSAVMIAALARHAERINGLGAAAAEDAEKNSPETEKATSPSTSRKRSE